MKDNFKFLTELMKLRLSHIMTFRLGFFGPFFIDTSYFLVQLFAFEAIYGHVDKILGIFFDSRIYGFIYKRIQLVHHQFFCDRQLF